MLRPDPERDALRLPLSACSLKTAWGVVGVKRGAFST